MAQMQFSINEKLCRNCMKSADASLDKVVKLMGSQGQKNNTTIIGCVEKMNEGFKDTKDVATLYKNFNTSLNNLKEKLNRVDAGFQSIDSII